MPVPRALSEFGFENVEIPPEQEKPDGNFPTVSSPNPEDEEALELAIKLGKTKNAQLVLATDPDSDRIACIVNENGTFVSFSGNELCCLLTDYYLQTLSKNAKMPDHPLVISTIVTTDLHRKIAESYNVDCEHTLTGFKWICQLIEDYENGIKKPYKKFVCGGEESYGFLLGDFVRDKDAVTACALAAEMVAYYSDQGLKLSQILDNIFLKHGVYQDSLHNIVLPGKAGFLRIEKMMSTFRQDPPLIVGGKKVIQMTDFKLGKKKIYNEESWVESSSNHLPSSDVLQFMFDNGTRVSMRPSGTEPKIKLYFSAHCSPEEQNSTALQTAKEVCRKTLHKMQDEFVELVQNIE